MVCDVSSREFLHFVAPGPLQLLPVDEHCLDRLEERGVVGESGGAYRRSAGAEKGLGGLDHWGGGVLLLLLSTTHILCQKLFWRNYFHSQNYIKLHYMDNIKYTNTNGFMFGSRESCEWSICAGSGVVFVTPLKFIQANNSFTLITDLERRVERSDDI